MWNFNRIGGIRYYQLADHFKYQSTKLTSQGSVISTNSVMEPSRSLRWMGKIVSPRIEAGGEYCPIGGSTCHQGVLKKQLRWLVGKLNGLSNLGGRPLHLAALGAREGNLHATQSALSSLGNASAGS